MLVLGIETSCDETGLALVEHPEGSGMPRLVAQKLATQEDIHGLFGGVVPEIASREHARFIHPLAQALFTEAGISPKDLDGIAVARGPGLLGCLMVGMAFAKGLALATGAPLVGVNHCEAHLAAPALERDIAYPAVGLLVSGGHTQLYRLASPLEAEVLGRTLDDAAGEAFDKVAKLVNLPYPGGRHIDALARAAQPDTKLFPRPYLDNRNLDFSFSGLKTAVATELAKRPELRLPVPPRLSGDASPGALGVSSELGQELAGVLASFTWAVAGSLTLKTKRALERVPETRSLIVAGGVACNTALRAAMTQVAQEAGLELVLPKPALCTDNGAMIAVQGANFLARGYRHGLDLEAIPRGRKVPWDYVQHVV